MAYHYFSHGADVGIRAEGRTLEEAFEGGALALSAIFTNPFNVKPKELIEVQIKEDSPDLLFYQWINAIIYEMSAREMFFSKFEVHIHGGILHAELWGEKKQESHESGVEVKGATMTELKVVLDNGQWIAQCIVDV